MKSIQGVTAALTDFDSKFLAHKLKKGDAKLPANSYDTRSKRAKLSASGNEDLNVITQKEGDIDGDNSLTSGTDHTSIVYKYYDRYWLQAVSNKKVQVWDNIRDFHDNTVVYFPGNCPGSSSVSSLSRRYIRFK